MYIYMYIFLLYWPLFEAVAGGGWSMACSRDAKSSCPPPLPACRWASACCSRNSFIVSGSIILGRTNTNICSWRFCFAASAWGSSAFPVDWMIPGQWNNHEPLQDWSLRVNRVGAAVSRTLIPGKCSWRIVCHQILLERGTGGDSNIKWYNP